MSEPEFYSGDESGRVCPFCQSTNIGFGIIPESKRTYERDGETYTDFFGETRDYQCRDCDTEWNMSAEVDE